MDSPLVNIGIPVYERATYVAAAIESVLSQSYTHLRLTISEELGPTDAVYHTVEPYLTDRRVTYVPLPHRVGVARHKSSLAARGDGKYIALLDDDDCWYTDWLARRVEFLEAHPECGMVWGGHFDIDEHGQKIRRIPLPIEAGVHPPRRFVQTMMQANIVATPDVLLRREAYVRAGNRFDERFRHIDDYELWLRMGLEGPVGFLAVHDAGYRLHNNQYHRRHDRGIDFFFLVDHLDGLLQIAEPAIRLSPAARRRQKADRMLSAALDAAEVGHSRAALRRIVRAAELAPRSLASRRGIAALAGTVGGEVVSRRLGAMRSV